MIPKIKYTGRLQHPTIRKRDSKEITHFIRLYLTTDEAMMISAMFALIHEKDEDAPTFSLFRTCLDMIASGQVSEKDLVADMVTWRVREKLARVLVGIEYDRCLSYLDSLKKKKEPAIKTPPVQKTAPPPSPTPPKVRREYIPTPKS